MSKRTTQQLDRAFLAGHPRWCPDCRKMVSTSKGKFARHLKPDRTPCPNSGLAVRKA